MSFSLLLEVLQKNHSKEIVLIKLGAFYVATGNDAVILHEKLGLKCVCFKENICKIGVPVNSLDKYLKELEKIKYSYVVYDIDKEKIELNVLKQYRGKKNKEYMGKNLGCILCKGSDAYKKEDIYLEALRKKVKKDMREDEQKRKKQ